MYDPPACVWALTIGGPTAIAAATCIALYGGAVRAGLGRKRAALLGGAAAVLLGGWYTATAVIAGHGWYNTRPRSVYRLMIRSPSDSGMRACHTPEAAIADDQLRMRDPERLEPRHLVRLLADKPQRTPAHPGVAAGHGRRSLAGMPVACRARCRSTANSTARSTTP